MKRRTRVVILAGIVVAAVAAAAVILYFRGDPNELARYRLAPGRQRFGPIHIPPDVDAVHLLLHTSRRSWSVQYEFTLVDAQGRTVSRSAGGVQGTAATWFTRLLPRPGTRVAILGCDVVGGQTYYLDCDIAEVSKGVCVVVSRPPEP